jgi:hypothetical protein
MHFITSTSNHSALPHPLSAPCHARDPPTSPPNRARHGQIWKSRNITECADEPPANTLDDVVVWQGCRRHESFCTDAGPACRVTSSASYLQHVVTERLQRTSTAALVADARLIPAQASCGPNRQLSQANARPIYPCVNRASLSRSIALADQPRERPHRH